MDIFDCQLRAKQVVGIVGIKYATLDYWLRPDRGNILVCSVPAEGKGSDRIFSFLDVVRIRAVKRLRDDGISLQTIRAAIRLLTEEWRLADPLRSGRLLVIDGRPYYEPTEDQLWDVLSRQGAIRRCVVLDTGELARETAEQVEAMAAV